MDKKNKELAKKNNELQEEISRLNNLHTEILKTDIKKKYYGNRIHEKIKRGVERNIKILEEALSNARGCLEEALSNSKGFIEELKTSLYILDSQIPKGGVEETLSVVSQGSVQPYPTVLVHPPPPTVIKEKVHPPPPTVIKEKIVFKNKKFTKDSLNLFTEPEEILKEKDLNVKAKKNSKKRVRRIVRRSKRIVRKE